MRESKITRDEALELLRTYNKEPFHIHTRSRVGRRYEMVCERARIRR